MPRNMDTDYLKAPFPYFGGKTRVADIIWTALGQPRHYIEPFFGSGAVLLNRPNYDPNQHTETINDKDGFICNVWRALQKSPDEVAKYCDWPVNHCDLSARKQELIRNDDYLVKNLIANPDWYDVKLAGYWVWAACCWIGSGLTRIGSIPNLVSAGIGVHAIGKRPHLAGAGIGVHAIGKRPHLAGAGIGVQEPYNTNIYKWFRVLSERLRYVRVVCGDWTRVCGGNWQDNLGDVGIFFDPPYAVEHRDKDIYHHDSTTVAKEVEDWCLERGKIESYRIVCAGYQGEYEKLLKAGWTKYNWTAQGGYSSQGKGKTQGNKNRELEILVFSPACIKNTQGMLI